MSVIRDTGGPAFPVPRMVYESGPRCEVLRESSGMTIRDYFAAAAMTAYASWQGDSARAILTESTRHKASVSEWLASMAYELADAMLAERAKAEGGAA